MWPTREDRLRLSLSLSLFLFRFACASRGGIGGVVERKAEIDFHGRVARSLPALLIGNCVPAIDKTAECESWEYVERSFHGFVCVCLYTDRRYVRKGESLKREGKVFCQCWFSKKNIYIDTRWKVSYIWRTGSANVLVDNLNIFKEYRNWKESLSSKMILILILSPNIKSKK